MKRFKIPTILESESEPSNTNCIWKNGDDFKEYKNGKWVKAELFASDDFKTIFEDLVDAMYKFSEPVNFAYLHDSYEDEDFKKGGFCLYSSKYISESDKVPIYIHDYENNRWIFLPSMTTLVGNVFNSNNTTKYSSISIDGIAFIKNENSPEFSLGCIKAFDSIVEKTFNSTLTSITDNNGYGIQYLFKSSVKITKCI